MCGITGIISRNNNHGLLDTMMSRITHRGPDGRGKWTNGAVSFGHLRLKIIDLSERAAQPMHCPVSGNIIVFNGEIYNYKEIRAELEDRYPFRSDSILRSFWPLTTFGAPVLINCAACSLSHCTMRHNAKCCWRATAGIKPCITVQVKVVFCFLPK